MKAVKTHCGVFPPWPGKVLEKCFGGDLSCKFGRSEKTKHGWSKREESQHRQKSASRVAPATRGACVDQCSTRLDPLWTDVSKLIHFGAVGKCPKSPKSVTKCCVSSGGNSWSTFWCIRGNFLRPCLTVFCDAGAVPRELCPAIVCPTDRATDPLAARRTELPQGSGGAGKPRSNTGCKHSICCVGQA